MRRRQFLAGTALLAVPLAGCAHPRVVLDMDEASAADIVDEVSATLRPGSDAHDGMLAARDNGSVTRTGRYAVSDGDTVVLDGRVYEVSATPVGSETVTTYDLRIDFDPEDTTPDRGAIEYADLPKPDRERLDSFVSGDHPTGEGYDVGIAYGTVDDVDGESVFVPDQQYDILVHGDERYRVSVAANTETRTRYRYEVEEIAASVDEYADRVRERYAFALTGLSEDERAVVEEAIGGGYFEDGDAFQSVADRFRAHDGIHVSESFGTWLAEYEGAEYLTYIEW